jgi:peptidoglycan/LPS O-acetylase OafA/YrhL
MKFETQHSKIRYETIDGLRTIGLLGIILMHIKTNNCYSISGYVYNVIIPSFTNFVFLFMEISAFGMCCGYYDKIINQRISLGEFYNKRVKKVLPFFSLLVLLDVMINHSTNAIIEGFADLTLLFGFLPNAGNITVIGVGWYLGLTFVFYIIFPFFCTLLSNNKKAWGIFILSIIYNVFCEFYFKVDRTNIIFCLCFFMAGGLVFLYKNIIIKMNHVVTFLAMILSVVFYYYCKGTTLNCLLVSTFLLIYAINVNFSGGHLLNNKFTHFISDISMEMYLSHMLAFRGIQILKLNTLIKNDIIQYITCTLLVIGFDILFIIVMKKIINSLIRNIE